MICVRMILVVECYNWIGFWISAQFLGSMLVTLDSVSASIFRDLFHDSPNGLSKTFLQIEYQVFLIIQKMPFNIIQNTRLKIIQNCLILINSIFFSPVCDIEYLFYSIKDSMICAGESGKDSCQVSWVNDQVRLDFRSLWPLFSFQKSGCRCKSVHF